MIWIVDASVAIRWFLEEENHPLADEILEQIIGEPGKFAVPELFAFEVFSILKRLHPSGLEAYTKGIIPLMQGGIFRQPMTEILAVKANHFVKMGLTGYDACYAALARDLRGRWLTFDKEAHQLIQEEEVSFCVDEKMPENWPA
jgi:predicted nucleic acid-binding protein